MLKKKAFYIATLIIGVILFLLSFMLGNNVTKSVNGLLIGGGSGLLGMSIACLYMKYLEEKNPQEMKQNEIEFNDERSIFIRNKAKAKAGDIIHWCVILLAYLFILIDAPLWMIFITIGVFVLYDILSFYFMNKYQKEM